MSLTLFTQPACPFCDLMKTMLDQTGFTYYVVDITQSPDALKFMKDNKHKVVPQLYYENTHVNTNPDTQSYSTRTLFSAISGAMEGKFPGEDGGIEE